MKKLKEMQISERRDYPFVPKPFEMIEPAQQFEFKEIFDPKINEQQNYEENENQFLSGTRKI